MEFGGFIIKYFLCHLFDIFHGKNKDALFIWHFCFTKHSFYTILY